MSVLSACVLPKLIGSVYLAEVNLSVLTVEASVRLSTGRFIPMRVSIDGKRGRGIRGPRSDSDVWRLAGLTFDASDAPTRPARVRRAVV